MIFVKTENPISPQLLFLCKGYFLAHRILISPTQQNHPDFAKLSIIHPKFA
jgi:hypothetical protein